CWQADTNTAENSSKTGLNLPMVPPTVRAILCPWAGFKQGARATNRESTRSSDEAPLTKLNRVSADADRVTRTDAPLLVKRLPIHRDRSADQRPDVVVAAPVDPDRGMANLGVIRAQGPAPGKRLIARARVEHGLRHEILHP